MKHPRTLAAVAALLGFILSGCQPTAEPLTAGPPAVVPGPSSPEFAAVIQAAVEDRNSTALDTLPAPRLAEGQSTADYRAKAVRDLPVVTQSKARLKSFGFWYTSFSTTVMVESVEVTGSEAIIHFKELTEEYLASTANGPSNVPSGYSLPQIATFRASTEGWQLDGIAPAVHGFGLPMSVVED